MPRRFRIVALSFWPGLAQIWSGQEVLGLLWRLFFASTLNLAIVSRWIWNEAFAPGWSDFLATLALLSWLIESRLYGLVGWSLSSGSASPGDRTAVSRGPRGLLARALDRSRKGGSNGFWRGMKPTPMPSCSLVRSIANARADLARHAFHQCLESREGEQVAVGDPASPGPAG